MLDILIHMMIVALNKSLNQSLNQSLKMMMEVVEVVFLDVILGFALNLDFGFLQDFVLVWFFVPIKLNLLND